MSASIETRRQVKEHATLVRIILVVERARQPAMNTIKVSLLAIGDREASFCDSIKNFFFQ